MSGDDNDDGENDDDGDDDGGENAGESGEPMANSEEVGRGFCPLLADDCNSESIFYFLSLKKRYHISNETKDEILRNDHQVSLSQRYRLVPELTSNQFYSVTDI